MSKTRLSAVRAPSKPPTELAFTQPLRAAALRLTIRTWLACLPHTDSERAEKPVMHAACTIGAHGVLRTISGAPRIIRHRV